MTYEITVQRSMRNLFVFFEVDKKGFRVKEAFQHLQCPTCGKFDESQALTDGVTHQLLEIKTKKMPLSDFIVTGEHLILFSEFGKNQFLSIFGDAVNFYPLSNTPDWSIGMPSTIIAPKSDCRIYSPIEEAIPGDVFQARGKPCVTCSRFFTVTVRPDWYEIPENSSLVGLQAEVGNHCSTAWIIGSDAINSLKGLKGIQTTKW